MEIRIHWQLAWPLLVCLISGKLSTAEEVQKPYNLTVSSYNLNTTLLWNYHRMDKSAYFFVELLNKVEMNWLGIEACRNISHHYCDLSYEIEDPVTHYKVRVKALVGSEASSPETIEFSLSSVGIIGPPEVEVHIEEKIIDVLIHHPEMSSSDEIESNMENGALNYIVYFGNDTKEVTMCDELFCATEFPISYEGMYCFSAQGISNYFIGMTMEKSKEICVHVVPGELDNTDDTIDDEGPLNVSVYSYNFNTTLLWNYGKTEQTPYFYVEILNKAEINWMEIETCQNITHHYCDLSHEIQDPAKFYKVRVTAFVGSKTSNPKMFEFSLSNKGIIGPPELEVFVKDKIIEVYIYHPEILSDEIQRKMKTGALNYIVYCGDNTKEATSCDEILCTTEFLVSSEKTYCFSAQGMSNEFPGLSMERSKETCVPIETGILKETIGIIIGVTVGVIAILAISFFILIRWTKARDLMPQSLSSIVGNLATYFQTPQQSSGYDPVVSTTPNESPVKIFIEEKVEETTDVSTDSDSKQSSDPGYQSAVTETEPRTDERENYPSKTDSYFSTDSSNIGTTSSSSDAPISEQDETMSKHEPPEVKVQQFTNSFGYDKPHCPKELL